VGPAGLEPATY